MHTPWITVAGHFVENLTVNVVGNKLSVSHSQLDLSTTDSWYKNLFDQFVLPYLEKDVIKSVNEHVDNFNGMTIEELVLKYGKEKLTQKIGTHLLTENRINTLLQLANKGANKLEGLRLIKNKLTTARINARVAEKYLWLSVSNNFKSSP